MKTQFICKYHVVISNNPSRYPQLNARFLPVKSPNLRHNYINS
ncbi:hypothetical protein P20652_0585 [Pseudoalteromonas sp. BSi20652]|nr:hypothetical protein P20652_0585 [Pseudoalteromonas sp. BSi20652]